MKVYVFKRPDGSHWADYADLGGRPGHLRVKTHELSTREDIEDLIDDPGEWVPERVRALAERMLEEFLARNQQPQVAPVFLVPPELAAAEKLSFLERLKWLFTGA